MRIARYLGYSAFFILSFVLGLYWTFPWEVAKDRVLDLANKNLGGTMELAAATIEPSWVTGVVATGVELRQKDAPPIKIEKIKARVGLFALIRGKTSVRAQMPLGKGDVDVDLFMDDAKIDLDAHLEKIQLDQVPGMAEMTGLPLLGKITMETKMLLSKKDPHLTEGNFSLKTNGLKVDKGGKVSGFSVPVAFELGDLELSIPVKEGKATLKNVALKGTDVEINLDGTINPGFPFSKSTIALNLGLKPTDKFLAAEPVIKAVLNNVASFKSPDGFYGLAVAGNLLHPRFTPKKP